MLKFNRIFFAPETHIKCVLHRYLIDMFMNSPLKYKKIEASMYSLTFAIVSPFISLAVLPILTPSVKL